MIRRSNFFKKVFAGSIVALQITAVAPVYTVLAVNVPTLVEDSTAKNNGIDEKAKENKGSEEAKKVEEAKKAEEAEKTLKKYYKDYEDTGEKHELNREKIVEIKLDLKSDKLTEEERQTLRDQIRNIKIENKKFEIYLDILDGKINVSDNKFHLVNNPEEAYKVIERYYKTIEKYHKDIMEKEEKLDLNMENIVKIKLDLKSDKLTEEEAQTLKDQLRNIKIENKKIEIDINTLDDQMYLEQMKSYKVGQINNLEEANKALKKYYKDIMEKEEKLKDNRKRVAKFILTLKSENIITNEELKNMRDQLYTIKEDKDRLQNEIEELKKYISAVKLQMKGQGIKKSKEIKAMEKHIQDIKDTKCINYCAGVGPEGIQESENTLENNKEKVAKIKLDLKSDKLTEEERQTLQDQLNNMEELNEKLYHDILKSKVQIYIEKLLMIVPDEWLR